MAGLLLEAAHVTRLNRAMKWVERQMKAGTRNHRKPDQLVPYLFRRFELKTELGHGGLADAYLLKWDGTSYVPDTSIVFEVADTRGQYSGWARTSSLAGAWGRAIKAHDRTNWEIISIQSIAKVVHFTLTEDMGETTTGQASCTFTDYYNGENPIPILDDDKEVVHDTQSEYAWMKSDAKGVAHWDEILGKYEIIEASSQPSEFIQLFLTGAVAITSTSDTDITGFDVWSTSDSELFDTDTPAAGFDIKITQDGVYEMNYTVQIQNTEENNFFVDVELWLEINDSPAPLAGTGIREVFVSVCGGAEYKTVSTSVLVEVEADQSFKMVGKLGNALSDNVNILGTGTPNEGRWSIKRV